MTKTKRPSVRKGRKPAPKAITLPAWDKGAPGAAAQERLRTEPATEVNIETGREVPTGGKRKRRQTWVQVYMRKGELTAQQAYVALVLASAAEGEVNRDALEAIRIGTGGGSDPQAARVDARAFFRELWARCPPASRPVVQRVVLEDQAIWSGCGQEAWDRHMLRLRSGLDAIA